MARAGITSYSHYVSGTVGNHGLRARFDYTDGFVGIVQPEWRSRRAPRGAAQSGGCHDRP